MRVNREDKSIRQAQGRETAKQSQMVYVDFIHVCVFMDKMAVGASTDLNERLAKAERNYPVLYSILRVLCAPTFKRTDFKSERNLHMIVLFEQHAPSAFAYF